MESTGAQQIFFNHIKGLLPQRISFVDEVAEVLNISNDSAYRRIRGEKQITLEEIKKLCTTYKISLDQLLHLNSDSYVFSGPLTNGTNFNFESWLQSCLKILETIKSYQPHHMSYLAKEVPFFYYFLIPEIAAFKSFFFMKSILFYEDWKNTKFSVKDDYSRYHEIWKKISNTFATIPGTEIWSIENITSTIHQIEFYRVTGSLKSDEDAICIFEKLIELIDHIELQAEYGVKLYYKQKPIDTNSATFKMYVNELIMGDNMQIVQLGEKQLTYLNHTVLNYLMTADERFNTYVKRTMDVITQKSTPISEVNEKERIMFFNKVRSKMSNAIKQIKDGNT